VGGGGHGAVERGEEPRGPSGAEGAQSTRSAGLVLVLETTPSGLRPLGWHSLDCLSHQTFSPWPTFARTHSSSSSLSALLLTLTTSA
jgi:hypothetical protein